MYVYTVQLIFIQHTLQYTYYNLILHLDNLQAEEEENDDNEKEEEEMMVMSWKGQQETLL